MKLTEKEQMLIKSAEEELSKFRAEGHRPDYTMDNSCCDYGDYCPVCDMVWKDCICTTEEPEMFQCDDCEMNKGHVACDDCELSSKQILKIQNDCKKSIPPPPKTNADDLYDLTKGRKK